MRNEKTSRRVMVLSAVLCGGLMASAVAIADPPGGDEHQLSAAALAAMSNAFRQAAERVQPAVVSIHTAGLVVSEDEIEPESSRGRRMLELFRENDIEPNDEHQYVLPNAGIGTGMIVDAARGIILTNYHVVERVNEVAVTLYDGRQYPADVLATDAASDMAVLQIENADELSAVDFADSRDVRVGDFVLTFGTPLGYEQTMTHGIVSAVGRSARSSLPVTYQNFIQTDAAINQGNSGGPLTNLHGDVIGMNTAIATETGYDVGIGFAIPSSRIIALLPRLTSGEPIIRGYLGVRMGDVRVLRNEAIELGWPERHGVIVSQVMSGTPAADSGLKAEDIVHEFDGEPVMTGGDLQDAIALTEPGTRAALGVFREGRRMELSVTIGQQPEDFMALAGGRLPRLVPSVPQESDEAVPDSAEGGRLGIAILPLNDELRREYKWGDDATGFVIVEVEAGSMAARRGLVKGDLITELDGKPLVRGSDLTERVRGHLQSIGVRLTVRSHQFGEREMTFRGRR